jgi:hypothetical protein
MNPHTPSVTLAPVAKQQTPNEAQKAAMPGGGKVNDAYAFTGMHHIFGEQTQAGKWQGNWREEGRRRRTCS